MAEMIWNSIIDHIPLWGWIVIFGVPAGAVLWYLGPVLLPIWRAIPLPIRLVIMGIGAAVLAYLGGRYKGRANAEEQERRRNAEAMRTREKVDHEIGSLKTGEAEKRLRDRWGSDDPK